MLQFLVILLTILGLAPIFKSYFISPNSLSYTFGGDGLVLYYDMVYQAKFGDGAMFHGMNYPYGEYIFLTDAQGALAMLVYWFSRYVFDVSDYAVGIIHSVNLFLVPVAAWLVYLILKALEVRPAVRLPFSVLVALLAPQMLRLKGHFGLAYPFLIPLAMLWFLRKYRRDGQLEWQDLGMLAVLVFFTFNNPYTGFGAASLLMCSGGLLLLSAIFTRKNAKTGMVALGMGLLSVLIPFAFFKINDPCTDRIQQQFGFFFYHASLDGLLFPPGSLLSALLQAIGVKYNHDIQVESWMNIGIVAALLFVGLALRGISSGTFLRKKNLPKLVKPQLAYMLAGSTAMFLVAANYSLFGWAKDWMEANLGPLLMFKASARIGWSFYFTVTVSAVVFLDFLLRKIKYKPLAVLLAALAIVVWAWEIKSYIASGYKEVFADNFFSKKNQDQLLAQLQENHVQADEFCAILSVPTMEQWSDLFITDMNWATQFYSLRISAATGLPLLNAQLSRISTGQAAEGIQLNSHPIIRKERLAKLPNKKDILVVLGSEYKSLTVGEQALLGVAKPILVDKTYSLYRLPQDSLLTLHQRALRTARSDFEAMKNLPSDCLHLGFDDQKNPNNFYGGGAFHVQKGKNLVAELDLPNQPDSAYQFSVWHKLDYSRFDLGFWEVIVLDSAGAVVSQKNISSMNTRDNQDGWIRVSDFFEVKNGRKLRLEAYCSREVEVDEVFVLPVDKTCIHELPNDLDFLWNGFKVSKK